MPLNTVSHLIGPGLRAWAQARSSSRLDAFVSGIETLSLACGKKRQHWFWLHFIFLTGRHIYSINAYFHHSLSLSLSLSFSFAMTQTLSKRRSHTRTHSLSKMRTHTLSLKDAHTHAHLLTLKRRPHEIVFASLRTCERCAGGGGGLS